MKVESPESSLRVEHKYPEIMKSIIADMSQLAELYKNLAMLETKRRFAQAKLAFSFAAAGGVLALVGVIFLIVTLAQGLADWFDVNPYIFYGLFGVVFAGVGLFLLMKGKAELNNATL